MNQPTGKAPCRECGEAEWHDAATSCTFIDREYNDGELGKGVTSPVLDSERVASAEGAVKFSKAGGAYVDMEEVVKSELAKARGDLPASERGPCLDCGHDLGTTGRDQLCVLQGCGCKCTFAPSGEGRRECVKRSKDE